MKQQENEIFMTKLKKQKLYEEFHRVTKHHNKIIDENDFTHGKLIKIVDNYLHNAKNAVDIGCGTGSMSFYLASKNIEVLGIDISLRAIESCNKNAKGFKLLNIKFKHLDLEKTHKFNKKFDLALCLEVIEHVEDDRALLSMIYSLLNSGAYLILSTPSLNSPLYRLGLLQGFDKRVGHLRRYDQKTLEKILTKENFTIIKLIKTESFLRNSLFVFKLGNLFLRIINRSSYLAKALVYIDEVLAQLFGESDLIVIAKKNENLISE